MRQVAGTGLVQGTLLWPGKCELDEEDKQTGEKWFSPFLPTDTGSPTQWMCHLAVVRSPQAPTDSIQAFVI